ncbi:hypothetical protein [Microbispora triticiradicis]|nr:hypothetical protein [Microbispora triticiradicis]
MEAAYRSVREALENAAGPAGFTGLTRAGDAEDLHSGGTVRSVASRFGD